jgi:SAM-dependent methyltransferase
MRRPRRRPRLEWRSDDELVVAGVSYGLRPFTEPFPSKGGDRFCLRKPRPEVERLAALLKRLEPERVLELGVYQGGSTALIAQLARPSRLVALELESKPVRGLEQFIEANGLRDSVSVRWGTDAADPVRLARIWEQDLGAEPLDLVLDDASHHLDPTRRSFEALFPRLRPGGVYVIEDWAWAHSQVDMWPDRPPLSRLVLELSLAAAHRPELIASIEIDRAWAIVERGPGQAEHDSFSVRSSLDGRALAMADALESSE